MSTISPNIHLVPVGDKLYWKVQPTYGAVSVDDAWGPIRLAARNVCGIVYMYVRQRDSLLSSSRHASFFCLFYLYSCLCSPQLEVLGAEHERVASGLEAKRGEMAKRRYLKVRTALLVGYLLPY